MAPQMPESDRCLCGLVHVKTGTLIFAVLLVVGGILGIMQDLGKVGKAPVLVSFIWNSVTLLVGGATIHATKSRNPKLLWPIILYEYIMIALAALVLLFAIIMQFFPLALIKYSNIAEVKDEKNLDEYVNLARITLGIVSAFCLVAIALNFWTLSVAKMCQAWMFEKMFAAPNVVFVQKF
ncbi:hypothetical protein L596_022212 [Steinernema carpocapsae]|uniref:MARVEL domain-containing protein n=1 Tax=Steinernema carpocapsae TaxID=34508 RepID=A0A4U5ML47_STECR|nr:hypothetical protein L596_022212 [Steinernema carpocapsae]